MIRTFIGTATLLLAALTAVPAAAAMTPAPSGATTTSDPAYPLYICEAAGRYCLGSDDLASYTPVVERFDGRKIIAVTQPDYSWKLIFNASPNHTQCVAAANNLSDVVIHPCDGDGVEWELQCLTAADCNAGIFDLFNRRADKYLSGRNNGTQFFLADREVPGAFQRFSFGH